MSHARVVRRSTMIIVVLFLVSTLVALTPTPASAGSGKTGYRCAENGSCKYAKGAVQWRTGSVTRKFTTYFWRGATASGSCDPSNDIHKWRARRIAVRDLSSSTLLYGDTFFKKDWYNCAISYAAETTYYKVVESQQANLKARLYFRHYTECCGYFEPQVVWFLGLSGPY